MAHLACTGVTTRLPLDEPYYFRLGVFCRFRHVKPNPILPPTLQIGVSPFALVQDIFLEECLPSHTQLSITRYEAWFRTSQAAHTFDAISGLRKPNAEELAAFSGIAILPIVGSSFGPYAFQQKAGAQK